MKVKKLINNLFCVYFGIVSIIFILLGLYFFRILYFAMGIINLVFFIIYTISIYKKKIGERLLINFIIKILLCAFLFCIFLFFSGLISYRPIYTYEHYKNRTDKINEIFPDSIPSNSSSEYFAISMEGQRYESTVLCFKNNKDVIESYVKNFNDNYLLLKSSDEKFIYNNDTYEFPINHNILPDEMKNSNDNYCYYYTQLSDNNLVGIAVNKDYSYICFFELDL